MHAIGRLGMDVIRLEDLAEEFRGALGLLDDLNILVGLAVGSAGDKLSEDFVAKIQDLAAQAVATFTVLVFRLGGPEPPDDE
jgi:hypothetical protein